MPPKYSHQSRDDNHRKTGRSEMAQATLAAPKRRYEAVEKGPSVWKKEWSAFMTNVPMEKEGKGTKLSKSLDLAKAPRQRITFDEEDEVAHEDAFNQQQVSSPSFSYLFASPAEKKAERDKRQREKEAVKKQRASANARSGAAEYDGDSRSKMQREMDEAKMRGLNLEQFANRKERREALRLTKSKAHVEAKEAFVENATKGIHDRMIARLPWYQQGPFPLDELAEKLILKKAIKKHARLRQMVAPPKGADGVPLHLQRKQDRERREAKRSSGKNSKSSDSDDDHEDGNYSYDDEEEEEGHHLKLKHPEDGQEGGGKSGDDTPKEIKAWKRMGPYNYMTIHPSWVAARGFKRMLEKKTVPLGKKTHFNDDGEPIPDGVFAKNGWLYNKCVDGNSDVVTPEPQMPPSYYRHFAPFNAEEMKLEMCSIVARALGLKTHHTKDEEEAVGDAEKKGAKTVSRQGAEEEEGGSDAVPAKPLSSKYLRVARKKARDAAIAEAIARGEEPPIFDDVKPTKSAAVAATPSSAPSDDAEKPDESQVEEEAARPATEAEEELQAEHGEVEEAIPTSPTTPYTIDDALRKKATNAASGLARKMTKKSAGKKVNFRLLVEGELRRLMKIAGASLEAANAAIELERKLFAEARANMTTEPKPERRTSNKTDAPAAVDESRAVSSSAEVDASSSSDEEGSSSCDADSSNAAPRTTATAASTAHNDTAVSSGDQHGANLSDKKGHKNANKGKRGGKHASDSENKKTPKLDMRGLNKKQQKLKKEREEAIAARKAEAAAARDATRRGGRQHDKPDPTSKRSERKKQRVAIPDIVKNVLPNGGSFLSSSAVASLASKASE